VGDDDRRREPSPVGDVVAGLLGRRPFAAGMMVGRLARGWADVVGERLAGETSPASLEAGVLTVSATSGPWGAQAQFLADEIKGRANEALGGDVIKRVRVIVRS